MIRFTNITFGLGGRALFENATAHIPVGHKVGLVGANGTGKTSLIRLIQGESELDGGEIRVRAKARVGILSQEPPGGDQTPLEATLAADPELSSLTEELKTATQPDRIAEIHERLDEIEAHSAEARAATILAGLGFDETAQHQPLKTFSGGWRMRVSLASVLFRAPDLLILDEPTNHLDLEATAWLENHLATYPHTFLMVSHDRRLLNQSVDAILHLLDKKLEMYTGGYDTFARTRMMRLEQNEALRKKQEAAQKRMQAFVDRFRAKATKARQAQSRLKMLERLSPMSIPTGEHRVSFSFLTPKPASSPLVRLDHASVGYANDTPVLDKLRLSIYAEDRIALLGANGNGKTTLSRLLAQKLKPLSGAMFSTGKLEVGYFAQDHLDLLNQEQTPIEQIRLIMTDESISEVRGWLGRFSLGEDKAEVPIGSLSGGEKTRLALALAVRNAPNLLILDEPTNHLDIDSRQALIQALTDYKGAVVLVSHDRHLIDATADQLWLVKDGTVEAFFGDVDDYYDSLLAERRQIKSAKRLEAKERGDRSDKKAQRRQAAEARARLAPLKKSAEEAENTLTAVQERKDAVDKALADPATYEGDPAKIESLTKEAKALEAELERLEEAWMEAAEALEQAQAAEENFV